MEKKNDQLMALKVIANRGRKKRKVDDVVQEQTPARVKAKKAPKQASKSHHVSNLPNHLKEGGYASPKKGKRGKKAI